MDTVLAYLVGGAVMVLVAIAGVTFWRASQTAWVEEVPGIENTRLRWTRNIASLIAGIWTLGGLFQVGKFLWMPMLDLVLPVRPFWPQVPEGVNVEGPTAQIVSGRIREVSVDVEGLTFGVRALLAGEALLQCAIVVVIAVAVVRICSALLTERTFEERSARWIRATAWVILGAGLGMQVLGEAGRVGASAEALRMNQVGWSGDLPYDDPSEIPGIFAESADFTINYWPVGVCLALLALGTVFRYGARLRNANRSLRRDVDGLV
ncbi:hypothetical protein D9V32_09705 [Mycetocola tolaasinivorans]|uniref:DUF2975 domain-containing protein n=1 Tax=Mycetocola tolaasinivorans TaxID=76635 RepID=A0A3L7A765_9MICO|nr:hypothetical protein [Mycetocola tolaasinivorans]RLP75728.1 hypothetical protein D9V32_09705 [Mycetocola tolaasinivorans]